MKICITNNTGLRNRGCEALVTSLLEGVGRCFSDATDIELHTNDFSYDRWRMPNNIKVCPSFLTLTPNHPRSIYVNKLIYNGINYFEKIIPRNYNGYPLRLLSSLRKADLVLPTGGDIFTSDYNNLRKHLSTIVSLDSRKAALIAHTVGPFNKQDEIYFKKSLKNIFLITVRESESYEYLKNLNIDIPLYQTADVAFGLKGAPPINCHKILNTRFGIDLTIDKFVALSVSEGIIRYSNIDRNKYFKELEEFIVRINKRGYFVLLIPHVMERNPNNNDLIACEELHSKLNDSTMCRILCGEFSAAQFKGIIGMAACLLGARTHATIASISQAVPTVSIAYSRKAYGIMNDVFGNKVGPQLTIAAKDISADIMEESFERALSINCFSKIAQDMKQKAEKNYTLLAKSYSEIR